MDELGHLVFVKDGAWLSRVGPDRSDWEFRERRSRDGSEVGEVGGRHTPVCARGVFGVLGLFAVPVTFTGRSAGVVAQVATRDFPVLISEEDVNGSTTGGGSGGDQGAQSAPKRLPFVAHACGPSSGIGRLWPASAIWLAASR